MATQHGAQSLGGAQSVSPIPIGLSLTERYSRGGTREFPGYHTLPKNAVPVRPVCQVAEFGVSVSPTSRTTEYYQHRFHFHLPLCQAASSPQHLPIHRCTSAFIP